MDGGLGSTTLILPQLTLCLPYMHMKQRVKDDQNGTIQFNFSPKKTRLQLSSTPYMILFSLHTAFLLFWLCWHSSAPTCLLIIISLHTFSICHAASLTYTFRHAHLFVLADPSQEPALMYPWLYHPHLLISDQVWSWTQIGVFHPPICLVNHPYLPSELLNLGHLVYPTLWFSSWTCQPTPYSNNRKDTTKRQKSGGSETHQGDTVGWYLIYSGVGCVEAVITGIWDHKWRGINVFVQFRSALWGGGLRV